MRDLLRRLVKQALLRRVLAEDSRQRATLPDRERTLAPSLWACAINEAGHLSLQDIDLVELAAQHDSPLHVVDKQRLQDNYREFVGAFRARYPNTELGTSYKTNPLPGVLQALHEIGSYAEVISEFELWLALRLGMPGERIIVNGPGKGPAGIRLAIEQGVRIINIDSLYEIDLAAEHAARLGRVQDVGVRLVTSVGWSAQFGLSIASGAARDAFAAIAAQPSLRAAGIHIHLGTGIKSIPTYVQAIRECLEFADAMAQEFGVRMRILDFGGGFGVPTVRTRDHWDERLMAFGYPARQALTSQAPKPADYAKPIVELVRRHYPDAGTAPELVFEPGRAITSSAQLLLLSVLTRKTGVDGTANLIVNGGKNLSMPLEWESHRVFPASRMNATATATCNVYGPLCHPGDIIDRNLALPELAAGDVLAIMDAGAYFTPNEMNFSNPRPAVVMIDDGKVKPIRDRETFADIVRRDALPDAP
ncbi:MAG: hypothetical protein H6981_11080 [Gammaproteobacteria bacterium]|nr:hypothetical protein [Gammaproteobacteria bacterium]MCP5137329.1 hypothetical protein [Gammaproteobacteria bacterium]